MFCKGCGQSNPNGAEFCTQCGNAMLVVEKKTAAVVPPAIDKQPENNLSIGWMEALRDMMYYRILTMDGRTSLAAYWKALVMVNLVVLLSLIPLMVMMYLTPRYSIGIMLFISFFFFVLCMMVAQITLAVRRLHDTNRSGFFLLFTLIPLLGSWLVFIALMMNGTGGANEYGDPMKHRPPEKRAAYDNVKAFWPVLLLCFMAFIAAGIR